MTFYLDFFNLWIVFLFIFNPSNSPSLSHPFPQFLLPILTNCGFSNFPSVSNQLGVVNAITTRTNATAVHAAATLPVLVFPIALSIVVQHRGVIRDDREARCNFSRSPNATYRYSFSCSKLHAQPVRDPFSREKLTRRVDARARRNPSPNSVNPFLSASQKGQICLHFEGRYCHALEFRLETIFQSFIFDLI